MTSSRITKEYDIIIVGGGTAGCVLGNRLSEDQAFSILVLEAGQDRGDDARVYTPGLATQMLGNSEFDWQYISEAQPGINGRAMKHPRGKMVGGSSAINSFALTYPSAAGLDVWETLGNEGWGWDEMKHYFAKFQTVCPVDEPANLDLSIIPPSVDTKGPIHASYPTSATSLQKAWLQTFSALGLQNTSDPLDGAALGGYISANHITSDRRERSHAGVAYYHRAQHRSNLTMMTGALVQRILFTTSSNAGAVATGVEYVKDGKTFHVLVRKEVILAAGAFATPQILELSGIGETTLLKKNGIEIIYHNPNVGENLQDHIRTGLSFEAANGVEERESLSPTEAQRLYEEKRVGPLAEKACFTFAYLPLHQFLSSAERQHISDVVDQSINDCSLPEFERIRDKFIKEMILSPSEATATAFLARKPAIESQDKKYWITLFAMLSHSFSRGSVHIVSPDVVIKPKIDFQYYSHPLDLEIHARHLQILDRIASTPPLSDYIKPAGARLPVNRQKPTLDEAKEVIKEYAFTNYHPCGTCGMMPESLGGVVDSKLLVYGTINVRVVDASMMPIIPRCNIITTVYACAEKAADIISRDHGVARTT